MRAAVSCLIIATSLFVSAWFLAACQSAAPAVAPAPTPAGASAPPSPATALPLVGAAAGAASAAPSATAQAAPAALAAAPSAVPGHPQTAELAVAADPAGALVTIDGERRGTSPLTVTLPSGTHQIAVEARGFISITEPITLAAGEEGTYAPVLDPLARTAEEPSGVGPGSEVPGEATPGNGGTEVNAGSPAAATPGTSPAPSEASPGKGGTGATEPGAARAPAVETPGPDIQVQGLEPVQYRVSSVIIPTYPYSRYLSTVPDPKLGDYPVTVLDRQAYEAARPAPVPVRYTLLELENRYLRLSLLPELGGRIYEVVYKPTGNDELYRNPVIKPTQWGPGAPGHPAGANWWLAAGGIEWGFPVEEHGYEWSTQWGYDQAMADDGMQSVVVFTEDPNRPYVSVEISLAPDSAAFTVQPIITNPTGAPFRYKWWANAMVAPGKANRPSADLRFIIPGSQVTVHSTSDQSLPAPGQSMSWPVYGGRDLSRLGNWTGWLGFFARPAAQAGFAAIYDTAADEGLVRVFPPEEARGVKGFGLGWSQRVDPASYTDGDSGYVELHGGQAPTFEDWNELQAGSSVGWTETWYPAAGTGGLTYAGADGALNVSRTAGGVRVAIFPVRPVQGTLEITLPGQAPVRRQVQLAPDRPYREELAAAAGEVAVKLTDSSGKVVLDYRSSRD